MIPKVRLYGSGRQAKFHTCHWPGCEKRVPPAMWGCKPHWFTLPAILRARVWQFYCPGQEVSKKPSKEYVEVARDIQNWIAERAKSLTPSDTPSLSERVG